MKPSKPFILMIPTNLVADLDKYLAQNPPNFGFKRIYFYYLIHSLVVKQLQQKNNEYFCFNINSLKEITCSNIRSYIKILENGVLIISDKSYKKGSKSKYYKLNEDYCINTSFQKVTIDKGEKIFERINIKQRNKKSHYNRLEPFLQQMKDKFIQVELDYSKAIQWIENNSTGVAKLSYLTSVYQLQDKRLRYFKRNSTNRRLDTNLTNMKKDLRNFIIGDFISIDLKNSQPFFMYQLIKSILNTNSKDIPLCCYFDRGYLIKTFGKRVIDKILLIHQNQKKSNLANLSDFGNSVIKGTLYEDFMLRYEDNKSRNEIKEILLIAFFSRNVIHKDFNKFIPYETQKKVFAEVYPFIYETMKLLKTKDHAALAIYLQSIESFIFIDCIAKELVKANIVPLTIHDSIIIEREHQEKALKTLKSTFMNYFGVMPTFNIEKIATQNQL